MVLWVTNILPAPQVIQTKKTKAFAKILLCGMQREIHCHIVNVRIETFFVITSNFFLNKFLKRNISKHPTLDSCLTFSSNIFRFANPLKQKSFFFFALLFRKQKLCSHCMFCRYYKAFSANPIFMFL